jgi:transcriptional regulator with XRE-family HTH domain
MATTTTTTTPTPITATVNCCELGCSGVMEGRKGNYRYTESGLDSVILKDIVVFHCPVCNTIVPEIPAVGVLHRVIAMKILDKRSPLTGEELRYLRKFCGYSVTEFAEIMGSSKSVVSRWETQSHGASTDRTVRLLAMFKLVREMIGQPEAALKNVTAEELNTRIEEAFKTMEDRDEVESYEISSEELAKFGGAADPAENEKTAVQ